MYLLHPKGKELWAKHSHTEQDISFPLKGSVRTPTRNEHQLCPQGGWQGLAPRIFKPPPLSCLGLLLWEWSSYPICFMVGWLGSGDLVTALLLLDVTAFQAHPRSSDLRSICLCLLCVAHVTQVVRSPFRNDLGLIFHLFQSHQT